jgi:DNA-binding winged helix-turn-helix (wHTH) protein
MALCSFRLDLDSACLWRESRVVALKPKPFAVLQYLVEHAGRLVTKEEIFDAVWPSTAVGDAVLKVCIGELRKALGETAQTAQSHWHQPLLGQLRTLYGEEGNAA